MKALTVSLSYIVLCLCSVISREALSDESVPRMDPPVESEINQDFAAFDQSGLNNHKYHTGIDYKADFGTEVKAGVEGTVSNIIGLDHSEVPNIALKGHNDCADKEQKIFLWDLSKINSCSVTRMTRPPDVNAGTTETAIPNCTSQCFNHDDWKSANNELSNHAYGINVIVEHTDDPGHYSLYAHLSAVNKKLWEAFYCLRGKKDSVKNPPDCSGVTDKDLKVKRSDIIGKSGGSYNNRLDGYPYHLHYEVRSFSTLGSKTDSDKNSSAIYYGYTPDLPLSYGYMDPHDYYYLKNNYRDLIGGLVIKVSANEDCDWPPCKNDSYRGVRVYSAPGVNYSVLGWTGLNQMLVANRMASSLPSDANGGDTMKDRPWYRIKLPSRLESDTSDAEGWIAAMKNNKEPLVTEMPLEQVFRIVGAASGIGRPLIRDYSTTIDDPSKDCKDINLTNCVRVWDSQKVWDNGKKGKYLEAKLWNGTLLAIVPNRGQTDGNLDTPYINDKTKTKWYEVYIPKLYFDDPTTGCETYKNLDQCPGNISTAYVSANALVPGSERRMDFENGKDNVQITSQIPDLVFSATNGYPWVYGDVRTGEYSGKYPEKGSYFWNGNLFAWLGVNQGVGRIDFVGKTAKMLSLWYSAASTVKLEACSNTQTQSGELCKDNLGYLVASATGIGNINTGRLDQLSVDSNDMNYVLFHDTGNFWLIDDLSVRDQLSDTQTMVPSNYDIVSNSTTTVNFGETKIMEFHVDAPQVLNNLVKVILNWPGSEIRLEIYDANNKKVAVDQSQSPPMSMTTAAGEPGIWRAEITAVDIPYNEYPVSLVVARLGCFGAAPTMLGTDRDEKLIGTPSDDIIMGLGGNDRIFGNGGNDLICGGSGNDVITGGTGDDRIDGGDGNDTIKGDAGNDEIYAGLGNDKVWGGSDNDVITGDDGNDILYGQAGDDTVDGGDGDDTLKGGGGMDSLLGGPGNDRAWGGPGDDHIVGNTDNDKLYGDAGNDTIEGNEGDDLLKGGSGIDALNGGDGFDILDGGSGTDTCEAGEKMLRCP